MHMLRAQCGIVETVINKLEIDGKQYLNYNLNELFRKLVSLWFILFGFLSLYGLFHALTYVRYLYPTRTKEIIFCQLMV